jgi:hypothetical protein
MREEIRVLTPMGMLGYGLPVQWFRKGVELKPAAITVDSGSTDSGPQKLGLGSMTCSREMYVKDISALLAAGFETKIPIYISSAGGDGTNAHVDEFVEIIREVSKKNRYHFKVATIYSDIEKSHIKAKLKSGRVTPLGPVPPVNEQEIDAATNIVAQMGAEPFLEAMKERPDVIVGGRAYDPAPVAAVGLQAGFDPALCWHMGKIMECGALCAEPNGRNIFGVLRKDHFELEPLNPAERCTTASVAAHTLYEKSHPYYLHGPGGMLDLSNCRYDALSDRRVKVSGSQFVPAPRYTVKLEGAKTVGYRSIFIAATRDPIFINVIDDAVARVEQNVREFFEDVPQDSYQMIFHMYGKNGVMAELEPVKNATPLELCVILEVAAPTQSLATAICNKARTALLHVPYPGKLATAGNLASPFTPLEIPLGQVCQFNLYHLMEVDSPTALFPIRYLEV